MSFDSLPEELLAIVAKYSAAASYFHSEIMGSLHRRMERNTIPLIWFEDLYLAHLASVNRRMRRHCSPILFSRLVLNGSTSSERVGQHGSSRVDPTRYFQGMVLDLPHIAEHIRSISFFHYNRESSILKPSLSSVQWKTLCSVLPSLPLLSVIPGGLEVTESLITTINSYPLLESISVQLIQPLPQEFVSSAEPGALRKLYVSCLNADDISSRQDFHVFRAELKKYSQLGTSIRTLMMSRNVESLDVLDFVRMTSDSWIRIELGDHDMQVAYLSPMVTRLASSIRLLSPTGLPRILIVSSLTVIRLHAVREALPLLCRLWLPEHQVSEFGIEPFLIFSYSIEPIPTQPRSPPDPVNVDSWSNEWRVLSLGIICSVWPFPMQILQSIASIAPDLRNLQIEGWDVRHPETFMKDIHVDSLAVGLRAFKSLKELTLVKIYRTARDTDDAVFVHEVAKVLKTQVPSLERLYIEIDGCLIRYGFQVLLQRNLLAEGGSIMTYITRTHGCQSVILNTVEYYVPMI